MFVSGVVVATGRLGMASVLTDVPSKHLEAAGREITKLAPQLGQVSLPQRVELSVFIAR